jgi:uncharacterized membrane protein YdjX (TVP38/TMEM64 family)
LLRWVDGLGNWAPIVFSLIYVLACVLFLPGSLLTLGAGILFGVVRGSIFVSISATLGATAAFLITRYFARDWIERTINANSKLAALNQAIAAEGWKVVGLLRLSPVFPFAFLNYALGLTQVSLRDYFFASWIGTLPGTVMYVYIGSLIGDLGDLGGTRQTKSPLEWELYAVGLAITLGVTIYITRLARKALTKRITV